MFEISPERIKEIEKHWDKKEDLCNICSINWAALTTSQRREIKHNYDFERQD